MDNERDALDRGSTKKERDFVLDPGNLTAEVKGKPVNLTKLEWKLLYYLFLNSGRIVTNGEIKAKFPNDFTKDNGIDVALYRLRRKLGPHHIKTVRGEGHMFYDKEAA